MHIKRAREELSSFFALHLSRTNFKITYPGPEIRIRKLCIFVLKQLMIRYAPAKINLGLHIKDKRPDSFHTIESVLYPVPLCDIIEFTTAKSFSLKSEGYSILGMLHENTIWKAYQLMKTRYHLPGLAVRLIKNIPPGSGLGGPSSDAAAFMKGLNTFFNLGLSRNILIEMAEQIGSDCPFFIHPVPAYATGKGEILKELSLSLKGYYLCIVFFQQPVSTAWAYAQAHPDKSRFPLQELKEQPIEKWQNVLTNHFEPIVFARFPELTAIKEDLIESGAAYVSMSGSGSAIFGIFKQKPSLIKRLQRKQKVYFAL